uniref:transposase n=1 Tax=Limnochorda pilosa TaxID=1555112 RepID=UPI00130EA2E1
MRDAQEPFVSQLLGMLAGRTDELERLTAEMYARGLSTRDIEETFTADDGRRGLTRTEVSGITEVLWQEYEAFRSHSLEELDVVFPGRGLRAVAPDRDHPGRHPLRLRDHREGTKQPLPVLPIASTCLARADSSGHCLLKSQTSVSPIASFRMFLRDSRSGLSRNVAKVLLHTLWLSPHSVSHPQSA